MSNKRIVLAEERFNSNVYSLFDWLEDRCEKQYLKAFTKVKIIVEYLDEEFLVESFLKNGQALIDATSNKDLGMLEKTLLSISISGISEKHKDMLKSLLNISEIDLSEFWDFITSMVCCSINYCYDNGKTMIGSHTIASLATSWNIKLGESVYISDSEESSEPESSSEDI